MSDGQHLMRIRAFERQQAWAPRYVANELAGTRQAADQHRHTAMRTDGRPPNASVQQRYGGRWRG